MNDDKKCKLISDMMLDKGLREGEGVQRLARAMTSSLHNNISGKTQKEFVYVKPVNGWREQAYANYLREMVNQPGVYSSTAKFYENIAKTWDEAAKLPKWKKVVIDFVIKLFGRSFYCCLF
jgi:hypothetical protein